MDISPAHAFLSDDDVNVKNSYVNCEELMHKPRELSRTPEVPPLASGNDRR